MLKVKLPSLVKHALPCSALSVHLSTAHCGSVQSSIHVLNLKSHGLFYKDMDYSAKLWVFLQSYGLFWTLLCIECI